MVGILIHLYFRDYNSKIFFHIAKHRTKKHNELYTAVNEETTRKLPVLLYGVN